MSVISPIYGYQGVPSPAYRVNNKEKQYTNSILNTKLKTPQNKSEEKIYQPKVKSSHPILATGAVLTTVAAIGLLIAKGKFKQAKQLAEHINFPEAKSMEDAAKFAKETLRVKLDIGNNLDLANYLNESFVKLYNTMKGKVRLPNKVVLKPIKSADNIDGAAAMNRFGTLSLGKYYQKVLDIVKQKGISLKQGLANYASRQPKDKNFFQRAIFHEVGHLNHKNHSNMGRLSELKARGIKDTHVTKQFLQDVKDNKIVKDFLGKNTSSELADGTIYGLSSPAEFVAETFSLKVQGIPIPKEVETLYQKYGGPKVG